MKAAVLRGALRHVLCQSKHPVLRSYMPRNGEHLTEQGWLVVIEAILEARHELHCSMEPQAGVVNNNMEESKQAHTLDTTLSHRQV